MKRCRDPLVHDLRVVARYRGDVVGQHLPGRRGRRRLASVLVLVQAARLDPQPRPAGRAAEVPRGDRRRVRVAPAPAPRGNRRVGHVGRRPPHLDGPSRRRHHRRVPRAHQWRRVPERAPLSRLAGARRLRGPQVPHVALGTPPRPHRQGRRRRGHGLHGHADRPRHPARRGAAVPVPARTGMGHAQGRTRLHRRGAQDVLEPVAAQEGAPSPEVADGEEHLGRQDLPARLEGKRRPPPVLPRLHRQELRGPPRSARGRHPDVPLPGQAADLRHDVLSRAQGTQRRAGPQGGRVGDPHGDRRRRRRRAEDRRARDGDGVPAGQLSRAPEDRRPHRQDAPRVLGRRAARVPRHHRPRVPQLLHPLRARAPTAGRSSRCSRASPSTRCAR